jgi:hypothetical protein
MTSIFVLSKTCTCLEMGPLRRREGVVFLGRCYVCCTIASTQVYMQCHSVQVTLDSVHPLSLHCTNEHLYKIYRSCLSMQACAAGYDLTDLTTPKLQLVSCLVMGLTAAKFKLLVLPMHGFSLSSTMHISMCPT